MTLATRRPDPIPARIRLARSGDVETIQAIEAQAAQRFEGLGLIDHALDDVTPAAELLHAIAEHRAWVVVVPGDVPVGYAAASPRGEFGYLQEIDVLPAYGRRGFGARLVERVCRWGREAGFDSVVLTTFRDVPWNGPFYAKLGFEYVPEAEWTPEMTSIYVHERDAMHLPWHARGFYRKWLRAVDAG
jgi:GNAT superfamily N-acetyltransferase